MYCYFLVLFSSPPRRRHCRKLCRTGYLRACDDTARVNIPREENTDVDDQLAASASEIDKTERKRGRERERPRERGSERRHDARSRVLRSILFYQTPSIPAIFSNATLFSLDVVHA